MKHGSLFSGIGGFDLAAQWMGWENIFQVEIDNYCQKVLKKNFPNVARYTDIKEFDGTKFRGAVDIVSGGFPCQPFSIAGNRKGKEDDRFLWHEMLRIIREIQPHYIVAENVPGILTQGRGLVFEQVCVEMENEGYEVQPVIIPACAIDAPHKRERVWFVANANCERLQYRNGTNKRKIQNIKERLQDNRETNGLECERTDTNANGIGLQRGMHTPESETTKRFTSTLNAPKNERHSWNDFPTQSPICRRNDGVSNRVDRIKSLGNAIVPQVAYEIFKCINHLKF